MSSLKPGSATSLAIVESPLQLLCAYEAIRKYKLDATILIRLNGVAENDRLLLNGAELLGVDCLTVRIRNGHVLGDLFRNSLFLSKIFMRRKQVYLCGSYFSKFLTIVNRLIVCDRHYYLDDGVATFLAQSLMRKRGKFRPIFTFFDVEPGPGQVVERHSFEAIRERFVLSDGRGPSIFVGQKLVEAGFMSLAAYVQMVRAAARLCEGGLLYFPHRGESSNTVELIGRDDRISVIRQDLSIELFLLKNNISPRVVYSNTSTALFSLLTIFPEAEFFAVGDHDAQRINIPHIDDILNSLQRSGRVKMLGLSANDCEEV